MAKNKELDLSGFDEAVTKGSTPELDLSGFDEATTEPSTFSTVGQTAQDILASTADTTLGRTAAGLSSGLAELFSGKSDVDKQLEAQGFTLPQDERSSWDKFKEGYYGGKESLKQTIDAARERSPIASTVGSIGSEISQMSPIAKGLGIAGKTGSKALDLAKMLGVGAGEGALSEISRGDAKLLEGDLVGTLEEGAQGAALGAAGAAVGAAVPKLVGGAVKGVKGLTDTAGDAAKFLSDENAYISKAQEPIRAIKKIYQRASRQGSGGVAGLQEELQGQAKKLANRLVTTVRETTTDIGKKIGGLRDLASENAKVGLKGSIDAIDNTLANFKQSLPNEIGKTAKDYNKVKAFVDDIRKTMKDLDNIDLKKAKKLSDELKSMTTNFIDGVEDIKDKELLAIMRDFSKQIDDVVDSSVVEQLKRKYPDRVEEYLKIKDDYRSMKDLDSYIGTSTMRGRIKVTGAEKAKAGEAAVRALSDESNELTSLMKRKEVSDLLNKAGLGKFNDDIFDTLKDINDAAHALNYLNSSEISSSLLKRGASLAAASAGKVAGKVTRATDPIKESINKLVKAGNSKTEAMTKYVKSTMQSSDSEAIRGLADKMEKAGKMRYSKIIRDLAETTDPTQKAIRTHALMQQPAFRQDLRATLGIDEEE